MKNILLYIIYVLGIISLYTIGIGLGKLIPIIILFMIYLCGIKILVRKNRDVLRLDKKYICLVIVFILLSIISVIKMQQKNFYGAISYIMLIMIIPICMTYNGNKFVKFFKFIKYIGDFLLLYGIVEFFTGENIFFQYMNLSSAFYKKQFEIYGVVRVSTILGHPIVYGTFLICLFWITYFLKEKYFIFFSRKISFILILINLILTQSRSCWITFIFTILIYYASNVKIRKTKIKKRNIVVIFILIIVIFILNKIIGEVIYFFIDRFNDIFTSDGKASLLQRTGAIGLILEIIKSSNIFQNIFGHGLFASGELLLSNTIFIQGFTSIDNQYVTMIYEQGIATFIIYILLLIFNTYRYFRYINKFGEKFQKISYFIFLTISINMFFYEAISIKWYSISMLLMISMGALGIKVNMSNSNKNCIE